MERPTRPPRPRTSSDESNSSDRRNFVQDQLVLTSDSFQTTRQLSVFVGTWNVNGKKPQHERELSGDLTQWLIKGFLGDESSSNGVDVSDDDDEEDRSIAAPARSLEPRCPDVFALGFQEIVDLNAQNLLVSHQDHHPWEELIEETLSRLPVEYVKLDSVTLVGLHLVLYVRSNLLPRIKHVSTTSVGTGIMVCFFGVDSLISRLPRALVATRVEFSCDSSLIQLRFASSIHILQLTKTMSLLVMPIIIPFCDEQYFRCHHMLTRLVRLFVTAFSPSQPRDRSRRPQPVVSLLGSKLLMKFEEKS